MKVHGVGGGQTPSRPALVKFCSATLVRLLEEGSSWKRCHTPGLESTFGFFHQGTAWQDLDDKTLLERHRHSICPA